MVEVTLTQKRGTWLRPVTPRIVKIRPQVYPRLVWPRDLISIEAVLEICASRAASARADYDESKRRDAKLRGVPVKQGQGDAFFLAMEGAAREIAIDIKTAAARRDNR